MPITVAFFELNTDYIISLVTSLEGLSMMERYKFPVKLFKLPFLSATHLRAPASSNNYFNSAHRLRRPKLRVFTLNIFDRDVLG